MATNDRTTVDAEAAATILKEIVHHFESIRELANEMEHNGSHYDLIPAFLTSIQSMCLIGSAKADAVAERLGELGVGVMEAALENWRGSVRRVSIPALGGASSKSQSGETGRVRASPA
jgi:hypothetical protein